MDVFFAMIVMPFSRSRSIESMTRSATCSLARKMPDCRSMASTRVVLPWSTWAMMATLRRSRRTGMPSIFPVGRVRARGGPDNPPRSMAAACHDGRGGRDRGEQGASVVRQIVGLLTDLPTAVIYALAALLVAGETATLLGLVLPGE